MGVDPTVGQTPTEINSEKMNQFCKASLTFVNVLQPLEIACIYLRISLSCNQ